MSEPSFYISLSIFEQICVVYEMVLFYQFTVFPVLGAESYHSVVFYGEDIELELVVCHPDSDVVLAMEAVVFDGALDVLVGGEDAEVSVFVVDVVRCVLPYLN